MKTKQRTKRPMRSAQQGVEMFLKSDRPVQADALIDVARVIKRKYRVEGPAEGMVHCLQRALRGTRLFEYVEGGENFYEPDAARRRRFNVPKGAAKSTYIRATAPVPVFA